MQVAYVQLVVLRGGLRERLLFNSGRLLADDDDNFVKEYSFNRLRPEFGCI